MKRFTLLFLLLLFMGCGPASTKPETSNPSVESTVTPAEPEEPAIDPSAYPIPDNAEAIDNKGTIFRIPNSVVEENASTDLAILNDNLLISHVKITDPAQYASVLYLYDLQTGECLREHTESMGIYLKPQIVEDKIVIRDSASGSLLLLDENFQTLKSYYHFPDWCAWYLGFDQNTLFQFTSDQGIVATNLTSGEQTVLLPENALDQMIVASSENDIAISYIDPKTQLCTSACLNLPTGTVDVIPFAEDFSRVMRGGDLWFGEVYDTHGLYYIVTENTPFLISLEETDQMHFLPTASHLLRISTQMDGQALYLYDAAGNHLSTCDFGDFGNYLWSDSPLLWSENHHGYFFTLVNSSSGQTQLFFWKITGGNPQENLVLYSPAEYITKQDSLLEHTTEEGLYKRANCLSEMYGIDIRIAEQCETNFGQRQVALLSDPDLIAQALDTLEHVLSCYPEGFFKQLPYGHAREIRIQLNGPISQLNPQPANDLYHTVAFEEEQMGSLLLAADITRATAQTFHHEISHFIEDRLNWDARCQRDALFSESIWLDFSPIGFSYLYSTESWASGNFTSDMGDVFVTPYSQVSPMEDRAEVFETAMRGDPGDLFREGTVLYKKLEYYSQCIRDCFDTEGWPNVLPWEEPLQ